MRDSRHTSETETAAGGSPDPDRNAGVLHPFPRQNSEAESQTRLTCRLTTLRSEPGLSRAAIQYLAEEMPGIDFCLDDRADCDVIWLVGYEEGEEAVVGELRRAYPKSKILVTKRGPAERWGGRVLDAGADYACAWPVPGHRLSEILHGRRVRQIV